MFDAWGKIPEGILSGHINNQGDFDECVGTEANDIVIRNKLYPNIAKTFKGYYCNTYIIPAGLIKQRAEAGLPPAQTRESVTPEELVVGTNNFSQPTS